jgi:hypothetical protein
MRLRGVHLRPVRNRTESARSAVPFLVRMIAFGTAMPATTRLPPERCGTGDVLQRLTILNVTRDGADRLPARSAAVSVAR